MTSTPNGVTSEPPAEDGTPPAGADDQQQTPTVPEGGETPPEDFEDKWKAQRKVNRDLEAKYRTAAQEAARVSELEAQIAKLEGKEAEYAEAQQKQAIRDEMLAEANTRIVKAEIRAAATGKLQDPTDALVWIDASAFEVGADGEVNTAAITTAIADLLKNKPYLAAKSSRFQGGADGGARDGAPNTLDDQIAAAYAAGNFEQAIALKQQKYATATTT
jgi:hypothetical protein